MPLRIGHERRVSHPKIEVGVPSIELDRSPEQRGREEGPAVLSCGQRSEKEPRGVRPDTRPEQVIGFHDHRAEHDEVPSQLSDESSGEAVCLVSRVRCGDERAGVGENPQRAGTGRRR